MFVISAAVVMMEAVDQTSGCGHDLFSAPVAVVQGDDIAELDETTQGVARRLNDRLVRVERNEQGWDRTSTFQKFQNVSNEVNRKVLSLVDEDTGVFGELFFEFVSSEWKILYRAKQLRIGRVTQRCASVFHRLLGGWA